MDTSTRRLWHGHGRFSATFPTVFVSRPVVRTTLSPGPGETNTVRSIFVGHGATIFFVFVVVVPRALPVVVAHEASQFVGFEVVVHARFSWRRATLSIDGYGRNLQGPLARRRASFRPGAHNRLGV